MSPTATKVPFAEASPAEIREAILPEDQAVFDEQYAGRAGRAGPAVCAATSRMPSEATK